MALNTTLNWQKKRDVKKSSGFTFGEPFWIQTMSVCMSLCFLFVTALKYILAQTCFNNISSKHILGFTKSRLQKKY